MRNPPKELDRRLGKIGRIKREWGTPHIPTRRRMVEMITILYDTGEWDILRGLRGPDPIYSPLQVYSYYRVGNLDGLPTAATLQPLKEAWESWIAKKECSEAHRRSLGQSLRHLTGKPASSRGASVGDLPVLLTKLSESMRGSHPRSFNLARAAAQAFAKNTQGKDSTLWKEITRIDVLRVTPQRTKHPMTPGELGTITKKMKPEYAAMAWGMATTGMGPEEYWGGWEVKDNYVAIHGVKRAGRDRIVPLIMPISRPVVLYPAFRRAFEKAGDARPYDLRRTYMNWCEAAGIMHTRIRLYAGHKPHDMTDIYLWHEVIRYIPEDAQKLRDYVFGVGAKLKLEKA